MEWCYHIHGGSSYLVNPLWKYPYIHTQKYALLIFQVLLNPIKLIIKINNHKSTPCELDTQTCFLQFFRLEKHWLHFVSDATQWQRYWTVLLTESPSAYYSTWHVRDTHWIFVKGLSALWRNVSTDRFGGIYGRKRNTQLETKIPELNIFPILA
jgi:hypothetical protein